MKIAVPLFSLFFVPAFISAMEPAAQLIFEAIKDRAVNKIWRLLEQQPTLVHACDNEGNTPLHWASNHGVKYPMALMPDHLEPERKKVHYLNYHRDNTRQVFNDPISRGIEERSREYHEIVCLLIKHGANVHQHNKEGRTPLHEATLIGAEDTACFLLENGASINQPDNTGWTPLHKAAARGSASFVHFLLERGASHTKNNNGKTPIDVARAAGFNIVADMIQECLEYRRQRCALAKIAFGCVVHPRLGAGSPATGIPQYVVQEIVHKLHPEDFSTLSK